MTFGLSDESVFLYKACFSKPGLKRKTTLSWDRSTILDYHQRLDAENSAEGVLRSGNTVRFDENNLRFVYERPVMSHSP